MIQLFIDDGDGLRDFCAIYDVVHCTYYRLLDSIVVSISACHVEDPGSIPGRGENFYVSRKFVNRTRFARCNN